MVRPVISVNSSNPPLPSAPLASDMKHTGGQEKLYASSSNTPEASAPPESEMDNNVYSTFERDQYVDEATFLIKGQYSRVAIGSLALATAGIVVSVIALSTAVQIVGIVATVVGIMTSFGATCTKIYMNLPSRANRLTSGIANVYRGIEDVLTCVVPQKIGAVAHRVFGRE